MGFATQNYRPKQKERRWKIHPVWRGIGCALILLVLIMSWYASSLLLKTNLQSSLPWDLTKPITIPYTSISEIDRVIQCNQSIYNRQGSGYWTICLYHHPDGYWVWSVIRCICNHIRDCRSTSLWSFRCAPK